MNCKVQVNVLCKPIRQGTGSVVREYFRLPITDPRNTPDK